MDSRRMGGGRLAPMLMRRLPLEAMTVMAAPLWLGMGAMDILLEEELLGTIPVFPLMLAVLEFTGPKVMRRLLLMSLKAICDGN